VKSEFAIRGLDKGKEKEKEKDSRNIVSVEPKGEREFVVMTLSKSHPYAAASARLASMWIQKINEALDLYGPHASNAPT
jgi:3-phosphoinositide dependent protein kinase-1